MYCRPLLWRVVVDSLLIKLNATVYTAYAHANDQVIGIKWEYLSIVADVMQRSFKIVNNRCKSERLPINPEKTETELFTTKRKTEEVIGLEYQSMKLNLSNEVRYLSVILWQTNMESAYEDQGEERTECSLALQCTGWAMKKVTKKVQSTEKMKIRILKLIYINESDNNRYLKCYNQCFPSAAIHARARLTILAWTFFSMSSDIPT